MTEEQRDENGSSFRRSPLRGSPWRAAAAGSGQFHIQVRVIAGTFETQGYASVPCKVRLQIANQSPTLASFPNLETTSAPTRQPRHVRRRRQRQRLNYHHPFTPALAHPSLTHNTGGEGGDTVHSIHHQSPPNLSANHHQNGNLPLPLHQTRPSSTGMCFTSFIALLSNRPSPIPLPSI